ncbi:amidase [Roseobacter sp.]|uniref:amidase n=1 Tax=Roseobacter sp. TaxID=1907202 RepID=UPI0032989240
MTDMFEVWDRHIHAFVAVSDAPAQAGPLGDVSVGVKDIIDVAGLPTKNGSLTYADALAADCDATVVRRLRDAGARIVGKTTTTEFAFTDPTPCRNPHVLARSPGGSSSGSGAAVGAGIVDIALGTQTAGSLIRPAAYCGAVGFKPSAGLLPLDGVTPLARSFDTVGIIARTVGLARRAFDVIAPPAQTGDLRGANVVCGLWDTQVEVAPDWMQAMRAAQDSLSCVVSLTVCDLVADVGRVVDAHRTVMCAEAFATHHAMLDGDTAQMLKPKFRMGLEAGRAVSPAALRQARGLLTGACAAFWDNMADTDLILTLPVPEGAPLLDDTTGFQDWLTSWTVFGGPLVCVPWGVDALSRPRSVMLAAHPGQDARVLSAAAYLEQHAPLVPAPQTPR